MTDDEVKDVSYELTNVIQQIDDIDLTKHELAELYGMRLMLRGLAKELAKVRNVILWNWPTADREDFYA